MHQNPHSSGCLLLEVSSSSERLGGGEGGSPARAMGLAGGQREINWIVWEGVGESAGVAGSQPPARPARG